MKPRRTHLSLYKYKRHAKYGIGKRLLTPEKTLSSKKARFFSPISTSSKNYKLHTYTRSPCQSASKLRSSPKLGALLNEEFIEIEYQADVCTDNADDGEYTVYKSFKHELMGCNLWDKFVVFMKLVSTHSFPLNNIAFILFLETVSFFNCKTTTQMSYSDQTKRFWKSGYRLFNAKFLYFMGGPKNMCNADSFQKGHISPNDARINFAVPSVNTLDKFDIGDVVLPKKMPAGIIEPVLREISESVPDKRFMLCAGTKKVTAGIDKVGGDVDVFGYEDGISLSGRKDKLRDDKENFDEVIEHLGTQNSDGDFNLVEKLRTTCVIIGKRIQEGREMKNRQEFGLRKFLSLGGEKWRESKYVYAISALHTSLYQLDDFIRNALHNVQDISRCTAIIGNSVAEVPECMTVTKGHQSNMLILNPRYESDFIDTMFIKQRTPLWQSVRKLAPVTGSTIHDAIGLRGLQSQKKHMSKILSTGPEENHQFSDDIKARLEYGTKNEENALATLAGIVLPTMFPSCCYVEEGCYTTRGNTKDSLLVVSPDGSIRECVDRQSHDISTIVAAVEVKCPFPTADRLQVHYSLPKYYVCQCLAEMHALNTNRLLYMSWSEQSSVVLDVQFDEHLWNLISTLISDMYDKEHPKRPQNNGAQLKTIKKEIGNFVKSKVRFLGEFPTLKMADGEIPVTPTTSPYIQPVKPEADSKTISTNDVKDDIVSVLTKGKEIVETAYDLQRRKATEVMIWVLTHVNRDTSTEIPCSVPVAFGLKDYKLTTAAMRKATDFVIMKCQEQGVQICSLSTDGQWIQLMTRDNKGNPLTILQHQRDVWKKVQKMSKNDIVKQIIKVNKVVDLEGSINDKVNVIKVGGAFEVSSRDRAAYKIKTPETDILKSLAVSTKVKYINKTNTNTNDDSSIERETDNNPPEWIPQQLMDIMQQTKDHEIQNAVRTIDTDLRENRIASIMETTSMVESMDVLTEESATNAENEEILLSNTDTSDEIAEVIVTVLKEQKLTDITSTEFQELISAENPGKNLVAFKHKELDLIITLLIEKKKSTETLRKSWNKEKKANMIRKLYFNESTLAEPNRRKRNPRKLSVLCEKVIRSHQIPKAVLNVVLASYLYDGEYTSWRNTLPTIPLPTVDFGTDEDTNVSFWYSYPENYSGRYIGKSIDCSHNLTHLRVRSCTTGIGNISSNAWKAAAKSNQTPLNPAMVEDLIDKQSVPNARTNFSEDVEQWMKINGYMLAAEVTHIVRNWYDACDNPGICAETRAKYLLRMRNFLLKDVDFGKFPPAGRYINKIPVVTFEGIMIDIDTKLQLHALTGPYNIRSVGSLAAETTVGILQQLNPVSNVSIKARDVPSLISNVVEVMTCKLNPERGFFMRTSRRSGVYPVQECDTCGRIDDSDDGKMQHIADQLILRNHPFDEESRRKAKRKIRFGTVSVPSAPSRGALPVRQYHRTDESKILASKRLGIDF